MGKYQIETNVHGADNMDIEMISFEFIITKKSKGKNCIFTFKLPITLNSKIQIKNTGFMFFMKTIKKIKDERFFIPQGVDVSISSKDNNSKIYFIDSEAYDSKIYENSAIFVDSIAFSMCMSYGAESIFSLKITEDLIEAFKKLEQTYEYIQDRLS